MILDIMDKEESKYLLKFKSWHIVKELVHKMSTAKVIFMISKIDYASKFVCVYVRLHTYDASVDFSEVTSRLVRLSREISIMRLKDRFEELLVHSASHVFPPCCSR